MPRLSVIIPVFNGQEFIEESVSSILRQSFSDFELIIIDDGSTDRTLKIIMEMSRHDARMMVFSRENKGLVFTLNELLEKSTADLVARMDADDVSLPDRFRTQVDFLENNPDVVLVGSSIQLIDSKGRYLTTLSQPLSNLEIQKNLLQGHTCITHPAAMFRREYVMMAGGYRQKFYPTEDLDLWLRLGELGKIANISEPLLRYRIHQDSISGKNISKQREAAKKSCTEAELRRNMPESIFEAGAPWRPGEDNKSRYEFFLRYGWWAYSNGQMRTSFIYGMKGVRLLPLSRNAWILTVKSLTGGLKNTKP